MMQESVVGIDATNLRSGGGRTHLIELLRAAEPQHYGVHRIVVWGSIETLSLLDDREWLVKRSPPALNGSALARLLWQRFGLSPAARRERCSVLLIPGGLSLGEFRPTVTMSRNLLPFDWRELRRYGFGLSSLKLLLLRALQSYSFRSSTATIFLTGHAKEVVESVTGQLATSFVIPHGVGAQFRSHPRECRAIEHRSKDDPFSLLYVSPLEPYKHHHHVVTSVGALRKATGWPLTLELAGGGSRAAVRRLRAHIEAEHRESTPWIRYHGAVGYGTLSRFYHNADLGVFASTCENLPNTLLEMMAAGLPTVYAARRPMTDIMGETGYSYEPDEPSALMVALESAIREKEERADRALRAFELARQYTWSRCANETLRALVSIKSAV